MASRKPTTQTIAFGAELARRRETAGLTRLELAKRVSVSRSYVGQVETGATRCREDFAQRLDEALDCARPCGTPGTTYSAQPATPSGSRTTPSPSPPP
jgi:transcriptional regulator with XRE-family HTH domain